MDCGYQCPPCGTNKACSVNSDCTSQRCDSTSKTCNAPLCTDLVKNGDETDVDCGGNICGPCADGMLCQKAKDCLSGVCSGTPLRCQVPSCTDGVKNGSETDKDCGGGCSTKCNRGSACNNSFDCVTNVCQGNQCQCPTGMILSPTLGGGSFCIDQYEVTYGQYTAFYNSNPPAQIAACSWNVEYTPTANWPGDDRYPVRNIDWCDAYAYCSAVGKRLCGKIGGGAGDYAAFDDPSVSQWFDACSAQGASTYPYGSPFNVGKCNGTGYLTDPDGGAIMALLPGIRQYSEPPNNCIGGEPGLFDMSGNVAEWTNECDPAPDGGGPDADTCRVRGGSFKDTQLELECAASRAMRRDAATDDVGIRCCLD